MSSIFFGNKIDLITAATPSTDSYLIAYDLDGVLKQKDELGVITPLGASGAQGPQGLPGLQGPQGTQGANGFQGFQGAQGAPGAASFIPGPQGAQGSQGVQGDQGFQGPQGDQGFQGEVGDQGVQGSQGDQGFQGFQGVQGFQGEVGAQGVQGFQGFQGETGPNGPQGLTGADGDGIAYYGQMFSQTNQTVTITTQGDYVPMNITGTFDTNSFGTIQPSGFGVQNDTSEPQLFVIIATADVNIGNNKTAGLRLFTDNGTQTILSETTCTATTGTSNFAKLMTQWMIELQPGEWVGMAVSNLTDTSNIDVNRAKIVVFTPGRQGEEGAQGSQGVQGSTGSTHYDISFAISDEITQIISGTDVITLFAPRSFTLTDVKASLSTPGSSTTEIDIKVNNLSILSTNITIESGDKRSVDSSVPPVIGTSSIAEDDEITIDIITAGTGAAGAKIYLIGEI